MSRLLVVIGGPTASGKSALAVRLARAIGASVVNADSMQLYGELPTLTARPTESEEQGVRHQLYGIWDTWIQGSAGAWLELVRQVLDEDRQQPLVIVGGTGLYLNALLHGIAPVPDIDAAIRQEVRALPAPSLHSLLEEEDPALAAVLRPSDPQRLMRGLEVIRSTGRSLLAWQADEPYRIELGTMAPLGLALFPPRAALVARIERRLDGMVKAGALDELAAFLAEPANLTSPLCKAVAVPELATHLAGDAGLDEAMAAAAISTRRYAKRQVTFLRHRLHRLEPLAGFGDELEIQEEVARRLAVVLDR